MKLDLINNMEDRQYIIENSSKMDLVDMLKEFGKVVDYFTETMVAEFYRVNRNTLQKIGTRNKNELEKYGYKVYKKSELNFLKGQDVLLENIPNRGLRLYPIQAVIIIGMMLTESEVAEQLRSNIIKRLFSPKTEINNDVLMNEIKQLRKEIEELNKKINLLTMDNSSKNKIINDKENTIINNFNYSRFLNHINSFSNDTTITKKEYIKLFNSYNFYHKTIGITILNKFMNENELIYGNDRITSYAKDNNILIRDNYKNHSKVFLTKEGITFITDLIINYMPKDYI